MKAPGRLASTLILSWMALVIVVFILVTVPGEGRLSTLLPELFWQVRNLVYPLFYSPSIL